MKVFLSCVSSEFRTYRLKLGNQLGALRGQSFEIKVQEDFEQGGFTLLDKLADYIRDCDLVVHLVGDACGARPTVEHVRTMFAHLGVSVPEPLPDRSYTQWEYDLALLLEREVLCYFATDSALRDPKPKFDGVEVEQTPLEAQLQREHRERIDRSGKHREPFTGHADLLNRVFYDLGLDSKCKIDNLPYKSLGSLFKGREDFLAQLRATLGEVEHRGHLRVAAITATATAASVYGLGGIGKTRAALEYAHKHSDEYTALLFVLADSPANLQQNLASLCGPMVLDLAEKDARETEVQVAAVLQWLQRHPGWFLILDNVDTDEAAKAVQELLGRLSQAGQVVITSRLGNWEGAVESLALDVLSEEAAADFLLLRTKGKRRKQVDDAAQARVLAVELGQLALALEQAGAYISRYRSTLAGYLADWQKNHDKVLEWFDERTMQYPRSVATTWQTSFERVSETARHLLRLLSWLAPDPIPESLLEAGGGPFAAGNVAGDNVPDASPDVREALAELSDHSLVKYLDEEPMFSVHRLVQEVTRRTLAEGDALQCLQQALRWVNSGFVGNPQDVRDWPGLEPLVPHVLTIAEHAGLQQVQSQTANVLNLVGLLLYEKARLSEAESLMRRSLAIDESAYGLDHPEVAVDLNDLAHLLEATNRVSEAELLMRRSLAIDETTYGSHHPKIAVRLNNLADLLLATNRLVEAEPMMRRSLAIDESFYGLDHPRVATRLNNLAQLLHATNRLAEAEPMMRRALEVDEIAYGTDYPNVARDLSNLALLLQATNRLADAEPLIRRALEIDERAYGPDNPNVAIRLNNLAHLLRATNRLGEAEPMMRRSLAIDESSYGPDNPRVATRLNNLAQLLQATNRLAEAEPMMRRSLAIDESSYGTDHPAVARDLNNLALLLQTTYRLAEAEPAMRRALAIREKALVPYHPDSFQSMRALAGLLEATGRLDEAASLRQRIAEGQERKLNPE